MTTYTWSPPSGDWEDATNWGPPGGPPGVFDVAEVVSPSTIAGTGAAAELESSNASGLVTLAGVFNIGTIFNGAEMTLNGNITSNFIETFVELNLTGNIRTLGTTDATYGGIFQYNGTVAIDNTGSVKASGYLISYNPGSLDQPNDNAMTIDGAGEGAWLNISTSATANASN